MANELDNLSIVISADTRKASASINDLIKKLGTLRNTFKNLNSISGGIRPLVNGLKEIANIDFSKAEASLTALASILHDLNKQSLDNLQKALSTGGANVVDNNVASETTDVGIDENKIALTTEQTQAFNDFKIAVQNVANSTSETHDKMLALAEAQKEQLRDTLSQVFSIQEIEQIMGEETKVLNQLKRAWKGLGNEQKQQEKQEKKLNKSFQKTLDMFGGKFAKRLKGRFGFKIIQMIINSVISTIKEGIQSITQFSESTNKIMSSIYNSFNYMKASFGSVIGPLIEMFGPYLSSALDVVANALSKVGEALAKVNGQSNFAKPIKGAKDYAESMKKAQSASLGIDELNVVNGNDDDNKYVEEQIDDQNELIGVLGTLKGVLTDIGDIFSSIFGEVGTIIKDVMPTLKPLFEGLRSALTSVANIVKVILDVVGKLIYTTEDSVNGSLGAFLSMVGSLLDIIYTLLSKILPVLQPIFTILVNLTNTVLTILANLLGSIFDVISNLLGMDFGILGFVSKLLSVIGGLLTFIMGAISYVAEAISKLIKTIGLVLTFRFDKIGDVWKDWSSSNSIMESAKKQLVVGWEGYASGGFPKEDGFFYANHNELVGQFSNGKTAVANNQEITEGIKQGVLEAMREANNNGNDIIIEIDGKEVAKAVNRENAKRGYEGINGGFKYGY